MKYRFTENYGSFPKDTEIVLNVSPKTSDPRKIWRTEENGEETFLSPREMDLMIRAGIIEEVAGRWKPRDQEGFFHVNGCGNVICMLADGNVFDEVVYKFGNCFPTEVQAQEASRRIKETLMNYHEELSKESEG
jgi:hypothetical protein